MDKIITNESKKLLIKHFITLFQPFPDSFPKLYQHVYKTLKDLNQPIIILSDGDNIVANESDYEKYLYTPNVISMDFNICVIPIYSNWSTFVEDAMILDNPLPLLQIVCTPSNEEKLFFPMILTRCFAFRCLHLVQTDPNRPKLCHQFIKSRSMHTIIRSLNNLSNVNEVNQIKQMLMDVIKTHHPSLNSKWIINHPNEAKEHYFSIMELVYVMFVIEDFGSKHDETINKKIVDIRKRFMEDAFPFLKDSFNVLDLFSSCENFRLSVVDICYKRKNFKIDYTTLIQGLHVFFDSYVKHYHSLICPNCPQNHK